MGWPRLLVMQRRDVERDRCPPLRSTDSATRPLPLHLRAQGATSSSSQSAHGFSDGAGCCVDCTRGGARGRACACQVRCRRRQRPFPSFSRRGSRTDCCRVRCPSFAGALLEADAPPRRLRLLHVRLHRLPPHRPRAAEDTWGVGSLGSCEPRPWWRCSPLRLEADGRCRDRLDIVPVGP